MPFRAYEAAEQGLEKAKRYLIGTRVAAADRARCEDVLIDIVEECGPVVDGYPTWHPLVWKHDDRQPETFPSERCGYKGLDHTVAFTHGFITCPYDGGRAVLQSVEELRHDFADITAEVLDVPFYNKSATPILVKCEWSKPLSSLKQVPKSLAVPLMMEMELPMWRWSKRAERWETMRPYLLGQPHGSRSSLFVDQETAMAMKRVYQAMIESGMFGPLKMD